MARDRDVPRVKSMPRASSPPDIVRANPERSFMHLVMTLAVALGTALLIACTEPVAPASSDTAPSARLRSTPKDHLTVPDSVWIPPSPVPPIFEPVPLETPTVAQ